jgi:hypothetical protein
VTALGAGRVFISHSADDAAIASEICAAIEARGVHCWIAPRNVRAGDDFLESIQAAIESAPAFVLVLSRASSESPFVLSETQVAFDYKRPIFPVRIEKVDPRGSLRMLLSRWHRVDAIGPGREGGIGRLAEAVARRVAAGSGARDTKGSVRRADTEIAVAGRHRNWPGLAAAAASGAALLLLVIAFALADGPADKDATAPVANGSAEVPDVAVRPLPGRVDEEAVAAARKAELEQAAADAQADAQAAYEANMMIALQNQMLLTNTADPDLPAVNGM